MQDKKDTERRRLGMAPYAYHPHGISMSWQEDVYMRLRQAPGERWMRLGELFEEVQRAIPLHYAMRLLVRQSVPDERRKGDFAQWCYFKEHIVRMNIERIGTSRSWAYNDQVRLREIAGCTCGNCGGPVVRASWTGRTKVVCLRCEAPQIIAWQPPCPRDGDLTAAGGSNSGNAGLQREELRMNYHENLDRLRAVIATECDRRMKQDHQLGAGEVAEWLVRRQRRAVIEGLGDIVCQVMEQRNDDDKVRRILRAKPELEQWEDGMRQVSETLGVPLWYLLELDDEKSERCYVAAALIHRLRSEASTAQAEALKRTEELLRPVMEGHPGMTVGEAVGELERQTAETIRDLEPPPGPQ